MRRPFLPFGLYVDAILAQGGCSERKDAPAQTFGACDTLIWAGLLVSGFIAKLNRNKFGVDFH
jgi:hypothetical protein